MFGRSKTHVANPRVKRLDSSSAVRLGSGWWLPQSHFVDVVAIPQNAPVASLPVVFLDAEVSPSVWIALRTCDRKPWPHLFLAGLSILVGKARFSLAKCNFIPGLCQIPSNVPGNDLRIGYMATRCHRHLPNQWEGFWTLSPTIASVKNMLNRGVFEIPETSTASQLHANLPGSAVHSFGGSLLRWRSTSLARRQAWRNLWETAETGRNPQSVFWRTIL